MTAPFPVPEAGLAVNQAALSLVDQVKVPPPRLLMFTVWVAGLAPPRVATKARRVGLAPIAGGAETIGTEGGEFTEGAESTGTEGGEFNCANSGISAANLRIDRPPASLLLEFEELPAPAAASGIVPVVGDVAAVVGPVTVADDGATLVLARGTAAPTLPLSDDSSVD